MAGSSSGIHKDRARHQLVLARGFGWRSTRQFPLQAMTFMAQPQALQVSMSILETRLNRCAHVIADKKMTAPAYQDISPEAIPVVDIDGARVRVVAGEQDGVRGPVVDPHTRFQYLDVALPAGLLEHSISSRT